MQSVNLSFPLSFNPHKSLSFSIWGGGGDIKKTNFLIIKKYFLAPPPYQIPVYLFQDVFLPQSLGAGRGGGFYSYFHHLIPET